MPYKETSDIPPERQPTRSNATDIGRYGWAALTLVMLAVMFFIGMYYTTWGIDNILHLPRHGYRDDFLPIFYYASLPGIELVAIPLAAVFVGRVRVRPRWFRSLSLTDLSPWLPLLMATTLVVLIAYILFSWSVFSDATIFGLEFGVFRWLGTALTVAFTVIWLPRFPRLMVSLAGVIAGPALFALLGYALFDSLLTQPQIDYTSVQLSTMVRAFFVPPSAAILVGLVILNKDLLSVKWLVAGGVCVGLLWVLPGLVALAALFPVGIWFLVLTDRLRLRAEPLVCGLVSAVLATGIAIYGAAIGQALTLTD